MCVLLMLFVCVVMCVCVCVCVFCVRVALVRICGMCVSVAASKPVQKPSNLQFCVFDLFLVGRLGEV